MRDRIIELADHPRDSSDPIFTLSYTVPEKRRELWDRLPIRAKRSLVRAAIEVRIMPVGKNRYHEPEFVVVTRK